MKTIFSKLEDNIFAGILVKKGENKITDKECEILFKNHHFCAAAGRGFIFLQHTSRENNSAPNFDEMSYAELKKYVLDNNIAVTSMKKADILEALKSSPTSPAVAAHAVPHRDYAV